MSKKTMVDIWKEMEKQHGDEGLYSGDGSMTTYSESISTGSWALDDALGIWGIPKGHIVQFAGFESSGKTLLALTTIAQWQKKNPDNWAFFVDAEFSFDQRWAKSLGVDLSRIYVYRENRADKVFERLIGVPGKPNKNTGEIKKAKNGILDSEIEMGGTGLGVIVIDSIAALIPPMEQSSKPGKANIALMARFLPPELRKLTPLLTETGVSCIAINHLRFKPDVMYGDPTDSPGGTALKHACSQMINLGTINSKDSRIEESGERVGHSIRAHIQKNKKAPPFRVAQFCIKYTEGVINRNDEIRDIGARYGVIERLNNTTWSLDGVKYKGKDAISEALMDEDLQNSVLERAIDAKSKMLTISATNLYEEDEDTDIADEQETMEEEV